MQLPRPASTEHSDDTIVRLQQITRPFLFVRYTDVLVGAPFYSPKGLAATGGVFVYLNDKGKGFTRQDVVLTSKAPRARFGRSISSAGDVNLDGYNGK